MHDEKYCIACESKLPGGHGIGEVCLACFQRAKRRPSTVKRVVPARLTLVFPLPCKHGENCACWRGPMRWAVLHINARRQCVYVGGPFSRRKAESEARRIRGEAVRVRGKGCEDREK